VRLRTLAGLALMFACRPAANPTADEAAIRAIVEQWNGFLKTQNDSAIAAIYTPDAILLPPGSPRVQGSAAIRAFWAAIWPLKASLTLAPVSVRVSADLALEEGNWSWSMPTPGGEQTDHGKYLVSWRRTPTGWRAAQDIWNSDQAPPTPAK
jgi:uncharacterized protein (TIGR02246 family)